MPPTRRFLENLRHMVGGSCASRGDYGYVDAVADQGGYLDVVPGVDTRDAGISSLRSAFRTLGALPAL